MCWRNKETMENKELEKISKELEIRIESYKKQIDEIYLKLLGREFYGYTAIC